MRRRPAALLPLALALLAADAGAQADLPRTRPERTDHRETSRYDEVVAFMEAVDRASPLIHLTTFGYTLEGRTLPLAVVGCVADASPAAVRASGRTVVYLQGNIHAGEVEGKEALQALLREIASGRHAAWLDSLVLLIAPIYNADGNERVTLANRPHQHGPVGGMGQRPNAQGLDLNRDHTKLESPEARSLAWLLREYDPHVVVDLHTTNGTYHAYHLTYAPPLHPNTPEGITRELRGAWLPEVTRAMRERGWLAYYYGNVPAEEDGNGDAERGWYTFDHRPRFGTHYAGLRNRFAILSEAYAYLAFADRIRVTRDFVEEILDYAAAHAGPIRQATARADAEDVRGRALALTARLRRTPPVPILMGEVEEQRHPYTGQPMLLRRDVVRPEPMPEFQHFDAADTERAPRGYVVPPDAGDVLDRLRAHGVRMRPLGEAPGALEEFAVDSTWTAERAFQGHKERRVLGRWQPARSAPPAGSFFVPLDQPLGRLAFTLLEPRSDDGFTAWNVLDPWLERGTYPILRLPASPRP